MVNSNVTFNSILEASKRLKGKIVRTPILQSKYINEKLESNIFLKAIFRLLVHLNLEAP